MRSNALSVPFTLPMPIHTDSTFHICTRHKNRNPYTCTSYLMIMGHTLAQVFDEAGVTTLQVWRCGGWLVWGGGMGDERRVNHKTVLVMYPYLPYTNPNNVFT